MSISARNSGPTTVLVEIPSCWGGSDDFLRFLLNQRSICVTGGGRDQSGGPTTPNPTLLSAGVCQLIDERNRGMPRKTRAGGQKLADKVRIRRPRVYRQLATGALVDQVCLRGFSNFAGDSENLARHRQPGPMAPVDILCAELSRR